MIHKTKLHHLRPWIQKVKPLWWLVGFIALILTPFVWLVKSLYDERAELYSALGDAVQLMTYQIEE